MMLSALLPRCAKKVAQSKLADPKDELVMLKKNLVSADIDQLKATKTVFFLPKDDTGKNDSIEAALSSVWDLTPLLFDDISNFGKYANDPQYSYFVIEGVSTTVSMSNGSYTNTHYYLVLRSFRENAKGGINRNGLCRIELYSNYHAMHSALNGTGTSAVSNKLYRNGLYYNWSPVLLKAQVAAAQTNIKAKIRPWLFEEINDPQLSRLLAKDTLYVPKRLLNSFNKFNGDEHPYPNSLFSGYGYKYRLCSDAELYRIFETEKRGRLIFEYVKSSTDKFVSIYDLQSKKIVYKKYTHTSYNLKSKDLKQIQ